MEASALDALALSDPASLADAEQLKALHARCSAAGLCGPLADGLVGSLHSLFDVALKNNLVSLVLHYITEVCLDPLAVSSDPTSAYLMDGVAVSTWAEAALDKLSSELLVPNASRAHLCALATSAADVGAVALALGARTAALAARCGRAAQLASALAWLVGAQPAPPRHSGLGAWGASVARRREGARPGSTCLDTLLAAAGRPAYPQPDAAAAARAFFLLDAPAADGGDEAAVLAARASLFVYYLLDAEGVGGGNGGGLAASFCGWAHAASPGALTLRLPPLAAARLRAGLLLDEACEAGGGAAAACASAAEALLLSGACGGGAGEGAVRELAQPLALAGTRGLCHPSDGAFLLNILEGVRGADGDENEAALARVQGWLGAGQLAAACGEVFSAPAAVAQPLVHALCAAACQARPRRLGELLAQPWPARLEPLLLGWLAGSGDALCAQALPRYFLSRGLGAQAAACAREVEQWGVPEGAAAELAWDTRSLLATRVLPTLPPALHRLSLAETAGQEEARLQPSERRLRPLLASQSVETLGGEGAPWALLSVAWAAGGESGGVDSARPRPLLNDPPTVSGAADGGTARVQATHEPAAPAPVASVLPSRRLHVPPLAEAPAPAPVPPPPPPQPAAPPPPVPAPPASLLFGASLASPAGTRPAASSPAAFSARRAQRAVEPQGDAAERLFLRSLAARPSPAAAAAPAVTETTGIKRPRRTTAKYTS